MGYSFEDDEATDLNQQIFETIYHAAVLSSMELSKVEGPYSTFKGSPMSKGKFQFDLWNFTPKGNRYDWESLRKDVMQHGIRNSLLLSPMPTASTSQILGNNESFEPYTSNIYTRRVLAGEFICINPHLVKDMIEAGLWTTEIKNALVGHNGSLQNIKGVPERMKKIYKTSWEIS